MQFSNIGNYIQHVVICQDFVHRCLQAMLIQRRKAMGTSIILREVLVQLPSPPLLYRWQEYIQQVVEVKILGDSVQGHFIHISIFSRQLREGFF